MCVLGCRGIGREELARSVHSAARHSGIVRHYPSRHCHRHSRYLRSANANLGFCIKLKKTVEHLHGCYTVHSIVH